MKRNRLFSLGMAIVLWFGPSVVLGQTLALPRPVITRQFQFTIPFRVAPVRSARQQPVEVQLYVSVDQGKTWTLHERISPRQGEFTVRAPEDGAYWFLVRTIDATGQQHPSSKQRFSDKQRPELIVIVDTTPPKLLAHARREAASEIVVQWRATDANISGDSLEVAYRVAGESNWQSTEVDQASMVTTPTGLAGKVILWPGDAQRAVSVRVSIQDKAGNPSTSQVRVEAPARIPPQQGQVSNHVPWRLERPRNVRDVETPSPTTTSNTPNKVAQQHVAELANKQVVSPPNRSSQNRAFQKSMVSQGSVTNWPPEALSDANSLYDRFPSKAYGTDTTLLAKSPPESTSTRERLPLPPGHRKQTAAKQATPLPDIKNSPLLGWRARTEAHPVSRPGPYLSTEESILSQGSLKEKVEVIAPGEPVDSRLTRQRTPAVESFTSSSAASSLVERSHGGKPGQTASHTVNTTRFALDYVVDMPGSREVANIQLWVTRDEGRSWRLYGRDEDALSPFEVTVPGEGIYGFRIVAAARSGLRGKPPQAGDLPNVTVSVDLTPPQCRIISVETTDSEEPGQLVILWEAADTTLPPRPVSLYIGPGIDGNWQTIATKLQNLGRYTWDIQEDLPEQIFIRLEVRDAAGNKATAVTPEAVSLSLLRPKATIEQVRPITSPERNAKRYQFFH